jgi:hypothetical protein
VISRLTLYLQCNTNTDMEKQESPLCFRANEEDREILEYLKRRLGANMTQIIKIAIRRLRDSEKRLEKR